MAEQQKTLKITLLKSPIGFDKHQKAVVTGLGLRRIRHSVTLGDTPAVRGMDRPRRRKLGDRRPGRVRQDVAD